MKSQKDSDRSEAIGKPGYILTKQNPLVIILGPTAVGKTEIAIELAEGLGGEIVSADSRLLYRGMDIGTAKPTPEQRRRIPHHLIDVADPDQVWSLTLYQEAAHKAIDGIHDREHLPFLVGGTGQYIRAVIEAWQIPTIKPDPNLRRALENWADSIGPKGLHQRLTALDPQAAGKIDYRNLRRTIRALEVILHSGKQFSNQRRRNLPPYEILQIGLTMPRPELYTQIDARIEAMLSEGFIEEVKMLLDKGYAPDLPSFSAIGYQEIIDYLAGKTTLEEAVMIIKRRSRQYVRRQANWFKESDPSIYWFRASIASSDDIEQKIRIFLTS
jgi:tRNA dimethylallyltransferase